MKTYITFGQIHAHSINGKTFDKDCVGVIEHSEDKNGHEIAMDIFDGIFHQAIPEDKFDMENMRFFPRGFINLN